jgi:hypothetical protein
MTVIRGIRIEWGWKYRSTDLNRIMGFHGLNAGRGLNGDGNTGAQI